MEVGGQLHAPVALPRGKEPLVPLGWEAGWAPEPFWMQWWREKFPAPIFENVAKFIYLGITVTNQDYVHSAIKRKLKSGNACYHLVQKLLSSSLLPKSIKIKSAQNVISTSYFVYIWNLEQTEKYLRTGCWGEYLYLDPTERKYDEDRENAYWEKLQDLYYLPNIIRMTK